MFSVIRVELNRSGIKYALVMTSYDGIQSHWGYFKSYTFARLVAEAMNDKATIAASEETV